MRYTTLCCPFLAGMVFAITLADHGPWDHHAPHEQRPEQVVAYTAPITNPTSGAFFFSMTPRRSWPSGFPSLVVRA